MLLRFHRIHEYSCTKGYLKHAHCHVHDIGPSLQPRMTLSCTCKLPCKNYNSEKNQGLENILHNYYMPHLFDL